MLLKVVASALAGLALLAAPARVRADASACVTAANEGQRLRDAGHYVQAADALRACSADSCPAIIRSSCTGWLDEVRTRMPTVVIGARTARGVDVVALRVTVDGAPLERLEGTPHPLDPGPHRLRFESPGYRPVEQTLVVLAGQKDRPVVAILEPKEEPATPPRASAVTRGSSLLGPIVLGSAGVVALVTSGALVGSAVGSLHSLEAQPCAATRTCASDDVTSVKTRLGASEVVFGIGAAAVVGAVLWGVLGRSHRVDAALVTPLAGVF